MKVFRAVASVALLAISAVRVDAQTCTSVVPPTSPPTYSCLTGNPVKAAFDWLDDNPAAGDVLRLYVDNVQVGPDLPALPASGIEIVFGDALPAGSYVVQVAAFRPATIDGPFEAKSSPVTLLLTVPLPPPPPPQPPPPPPPPPPPAPVAPTSLRIIDITMLGVDDSGNVLWQYALSFAVAD